MKWFITGEPGSGKTTLVILIVEKLKVEGINVDGIITKEIREKNVRTGFEIIDIKTKRKGILASKKLKIEGPRIGSYVVNIEDIDLFAVEVLYRALKEADIIVCDEIGAMELCSENFKIVLDKILMSKKPLLATLHRRYIYYSEKVPLEKRKLIYLTREKWGVILNQLTYEILSYLKNK